MRKIGKLLLNRNLNVVKNFLEGLKQMKSTRLLLIKKEFLGEPDFWGEMLGPNLTDFMKI